MAQLTHRSGTDPALFAQDDDASLALLPVEQPDHILERYRGTPVAELLAAHNLGRTLPVTPAAELLIITCMDHRVTFDIPEFFAYQLRTAGATVAPILSNVAFAVAVANVKAICVIGHTDCAMCRVENRCDTLIDTLVERESWCPEEAKDYAAHLKKVFRVEDPARATWSAARRVASLFPSCLVAPLLFRVDDGALFQIV